MTEHNYIVSRLSVASFFGFLSNGRRRWLKYSYHIYIVDLQIIIGYIQVNIYYNYYANSQQRTLFECTLQKLDTALPGQYINNAMHISIFYHESNYISQLTIVNAFITHTFSLILIVVVTSGKITHITWRKYYHLQCVLVLNGCHSPYGLHT